MLWHSTSHTRMWYCWHAVMHSALSLAGMVLLQSKQAGQPASVAGLHKSWGPASGWQK